MTLFPPFFHLSANHLFATPLCGLSSSVVKLLGLLGLSDLTTEIQGTQWSQKAIWQKKEWQKN
jgi:hypothetical protein